MSAKSIKLVIAGCSGRMGQAIARCALQDSVFSIAGALEAVGHDAVGRDLSAVLGRPLDGPVRVGDDAQQAISQGDVLIEFTAPDVTVAHAQLAQQLRKPMVIGTTGLSETQVKTLRLVGGAIPVVLSPNMSPGVNVLMELAQAAARRLGPGYDIEVVESHHREKKDSPSGTAKRLVAALAAATAARNKAIAVHAVRAGDIVGDHTVILAGPFERLELTHRAHARDVFARGALLAARFVVGKKPGLYEMSDVLGQAR